MSGLPAWTAAFDSDTLAEVVALPIDDVRDWAFAGSTGAGVDVAVIDSGVSSDHPAVGELAGSVAFESDPDDPDVVRTVVGAHEDLVGHGTACAGIIRALAPDARIHSIRVLGANLKGRGPLLEAGVRWAVDHRMQVANLSLSSKSEAMFGRLHRVADAAYFTGAVLVCAANNQPGPTYPSEYASVVSVACEPGVDPWSLAYNPTPPVEFGARGIDIEVAWSGGGSILASGNSFAAPHVAGMVATLLAKHPGLTPFQVKAVLQAASHNAVAAP